MSNTTKRECGTCTKCCEGYVSGEVNGIPFHNGQPCHFLSIGIGCSIYEIRPISPCKNYKCMWLVDPDLPEWMKPNVVNAIIDMRVTSNGIPYISMIEAGEVLNSKVLSWVFQYAVKNKLNLAWEVERGRNLIGSSDFLQAMQSSKSN